MRLSARAMTAAMLCALLASDPASAAGQHVAPSPVRASYQSGSLPAPVFRSVAVALGGKIYLFGGLNTAGATIASIDAFSPTTGRATVVGSLALPTHGSAAAVVAGRALDFGGASSSVHNVVQYFNPATKKTVVISRLPAPRADTTAATSGPTTVLVGGFNGIGAQGDVWATTNGTRFRLVARLPQPVRYPAALASKGTVYVFGGLITGSEYQGLFSNDIQAVNLATGTARVIGHLPTPIAHAMAASLGGHLYVIGGSTPAGTSAQVLEFLPSAGRMVVVGRLPTPITDAGIATIGSTVYVLGGLAGMVPSARIIALRRSR